MLKPCTSNWLQTIYWFWLVENIIVIYLDGSEFFLPNFHCLFWPPNYWRHATPPTYFHGSASVLYKLQYCPLFFSIVLDSILFGSNKGYRLCSHLPSFPQTMYIKLVLITKMGRALTTHAFCF
jgi:hypothetical protein